MLFDKKELMKRLEEDIFNLEEQFEKETPEFISLLSPEEEEAMNKEQIPETLPILPLRNTVLYPGVVIPITAGRDKSIQLINDAYKGNKLIGVISQKSAEVENPEPDDLFKVGTVAKIIKLVRMPDGNITIIIQGKRRILTEEYVQEEPYFIARVKALVEENPEKGEELAATISTIKDLAKQIIKLSPNIPSEAVIAINNIESPSFLINFIASNLNVEIEAKQEILEINEIQAKAEEVLYHMQREQKMLELKNQIQSKVKTDIDKQQKDFFLQQQLKAIQEELGHDTPDKEIEEMEERAKKKKWSDEVAEQFNKELNKLKRMNPAAAEYSVVMNYLDLLLELPWNEYTHDKLDLSRARKVLNNDHYGLEKVKDRILEYLAVLKLKGDMKSPILCLYGPPGVGKTSLGKSIAKSLGRKYTRMSLGGLHDESEIRGHRKTYIGAMPGRIIQSIKKAKSSNPVIVLDELDKIGKDFRGDPASALLEVLDPEQNSTFYDNYLELEFDLSKVLFVATANSLDTIHPALRDRLEIIELSGYLVEEKIQIAKRHLVQKQRESHGLNAKDFSIKENALQRLVEGYTRESGVRTLEKKIADLARNKAKRIVFDENPPANVSIKEIETVLGPSIFDKDTYTSDQLPGIVTGLAWTPVGGDTLYIETSLSPGKGRLQLTGKLGDVMKESAQIAHSYLKANYKDFNIDPQAFEVWDIHVHVPEGSVPKEGPSAGITMLTALASAFSQRKVKSKLAMTGELTLRGSVLPVGGIKEKILAAKRFGIKEIILSEHNRKDIHKINQEYLEGLSFHFVKRAEEVIPLALEKKSVKNPIEINHPEFAGWMLQQQRPQAKA